MQQMTHESFSHNETLLPGSERSFGIVMAIVLALIALVNYWHDGRIWLWMAGIAAVFLTAAFVLPAALKPLNWIWFRFGLLLHAVVNPIVLGFMFYLTILPTGLVMRALGKDLLRLKREPDSDSYWIVRQPPGPAPETMKDQF